MKKVIQKLREGHRVSYEDLKEALAPLFPMLNDLVNTPQDPVWHAEGNVEIHTRNVTHLMYDYLDKLDIRDGYERVALVLAALFHDIVKPVTTRSRKKGGRTQVVAPRHAARGRSYIAYRSLQLGLPYDHVQNLMNVVGLHHEPKWMVMKEKGPGAYAHLAQKTRPKHLWALEMADMYGRKCDDQKEQVEQIEMFRLYCEEYGVWDQDPLSNWKSVIRENTEEWWAPASSTSSSSSEQDYEAFLERAFMEGVWDYRDGLIYTPEEAASRAMAGGKEMSRLYVMCGPSGSGKSSYIQNHLAHCNIVSLDSLREEITGSRKDQSQNGKVLQLAKERLKESLRANEDVVWDATGIRKDFRSLPLRLGCDYGAHSTLVVFHLSIPSFRERNKDRDHSVPDEVLEKQIDSVQFPYEGVEAHRTIFVDKEGQPLRDSRYYYYPHHHHNQPPPYDDPLE